jgi:hypothetical protein
MSIVGQFPGINAFKRNVIRAPVNPLDKSTIVSIYPKEIDEIKHTISPGRFIIPPGSYEKPSVLVVGSSSWWREIDEDQPALEIPHSSIQIADSIVKDYCNGIFGCNMSDAMPGLFYVPGEFDVFLIRKQYLQELNKALDRQRKWYTILVRFADSLWARSNGNPMVVSDDMRMAAKELNVHTTKDWMKEFQMVDMVRCKACGSLKNPLYPVCSSCHFPDPDHPMTKSLVEAKAQMPTNK